MSCKIVVKCFSMFSVEGSFWLGCGTSDCERRAMKSPMTIFPCGHGSRAAVTATRHPLPLLNKVSRLSHCHNSLPVTRRRNSGAPLAAYSTIP